MGNKVSGSLVPSKWIHAQIPKHEENKKTNETFSATTSAGALDTAKEFSLALKRMKGRRKRVHKMVIPTGQPSTKAMQNKKIEEETRILLGWNSLWPSHRVRCCSSGRLLDLIKIYYFGSSRFFTVKNAQALFHSQSVTRIRWSYSRFLSLPLSLSRCAWVHDQIEFPLSREHLSHALLILLCAPAVYVCHE